MKSRQKTTPENLSRLATEQPNRASADLDLKSALEIARIINAEDAKVRPRCSVLFRKSRAPST